MLSGLDCSLLKLNHARRTWDVELVHYNCYPYSLCKQIDNNSLFWYSTQSLPIRKVWMLANLWQSMYWFPVPFILQLVVCLHHLWYGHPFTEGPVNEVIHLKPFISVKNIHSWQLQAFTYSEALGRGDLPAMLPTKSLPTTKAMIMQIFKNDMAQNIPLIGKPTIRTHNMLLWYDKFSSL